MTDTQTLTPQLTTNEGDHEKLAHYVIGGAEALLRSIVDGIPCTALCGKVWIPSRNPDNFPVCPDCKRLKDDGGWNVV